MAEPAEDIEFSDLNYEIDVLSSNDMADDAARRLNRLAERAKKLDDVIQKAAQMQKRIVEEIRRIGTDTKQVNQRVTRVPRPKARKKRAVGNR